jgi:hypothetical protein
MTYLIIDILFIDFRYYFTFLLRFDIELLTIRDDADIG